MAESYFQINKTDLRKSLTLQFHKKNWICGTKLPKFPVEIEQEAM